MLLITRLQHKNIDYNITFSFTLSDFLLNLILQHDMLSFDRDMIP